MEHRHPIKVVALRTGLSPHLIRMWERRYGAVRPERTGTNRRLYSDEDIERLLLLKVATSAGESIGQIAGLSREDLLLLVGSESGESRTAMPTGTDHESVDRYLKLCVEAVRKFDSQLFESRLLQATAVLGQQALLNDLLIPLLNKIGEMWNSGEVRVSHEHLASTVVRSLLGSMMSAIRLDDSAPRFVVTTPSGQFHEFGALMAAVTAASLGWKVVYLGPNMPAEDIAQAAKDSNAPLVGLSLVYPVDDPGLESEVRKLKYLLGDEIIIVVGGRAVQGYEAVIKELGLLKVRNLDDLRSQLEAIRSAMRVGQSAKVHKSKNNESIH